MAVGGSVKRGVPAGGLFVVQVVVLIERIRGGKGVQGRLGDVLVVGVGELAQHSCRFEGADDCRRPDGRQ